MTRNAKIAPATDLAQAGHFLDAETRAVVPPISSATTFARDDDYALSGGYVYSRYDSPTYAPAEALIARLEGGAQSLLFGSGLAAATAVFEPLRAGDHVIAPLIMYHGLQHWLRVLAERRGIGLSLVDAPDPDAIAAAMTATTRLVWVETLLNPTWDVIDIARAAEIAHEGGAMLGVDATVSPPVTCRPLDLGADVVFHSATKYLNGHSDVLGGVLTTARDDERWAEIADVRKHVGGVMGPFEAWLLLRGMRTLALRFERASENAMAIAEHFKDHPALDAVLYPGLPTHPGHAIAARQMTGGFGGMMSLMVRGGAPEALTVAKALEIFVPATSLGGVESLVEHRATVEGPDSAVPRNLLRLSVGIEDAGDLIGDLEQALSRAP